MSKVQADREGAGRLAPGVRGCGRTAALSVLAAVLCLPAPTTYAQVACEETLLHDATLTEDLLCEGNGPALGADGITLDCAGHAIRGSGGTVDAAVRVLGVRGATIRNCGIEGFSGGIRIADAPDLKILANRVRGVRWYGLVADRSPGLIMADNHLEALFQVSARDCAGAILERNRFEPVEYRGTLTPGSVVFSRSPRLRLAENTSELGVTFNLFEDSGESLITDNTLGGTSGLALYDNSRSRVVGNRLGPALPGSTAVPLGITLSTSTECDVLENAILGHRGFAVFLGSSSRGPAGEPLGSDRNRLVGNRIETPGSGLVVLEGSDNVISDNQIAGAEVGIILVSYEAFGSAPSHRNRFDGNTVRDGGYGIVAMDGTASQFLGNTIQSAVIGVLDLGIPPSPGELSNRYQDNRVQDSRFFGFIVWGSSPEILANRLVGNGSDASPIPPEFSPFTEIVGSLRGGIVIVPFAGTLNLLDDGDPLNDLLASPRIGRPGLANIFERNGEVDLYAIDTRAGNDASLATDNLFEFEPAAVGGFPPGKGNTDSRTDRRDSGARGGLRMRQDWFGLVRVENPSGNAVPGAAVEVRDAAGAVVELLTTGAAGFGPAASDPARSQGRSPGDEGGEAPAWARFTEYTVDRTGRRTEATPHLLSARSGGEAGRSRFSWDGLDNDPGGYQIIGGRYQIARVRLGNACTSLADIRREIDVLALPADGLRRGLLAKLDAASRAIDARRRGEAGRILCALLEEIRALRGERIPAEGADDVAACIQEVAAALELPWNCPLGASDAPGQSSLLPREAAAAAPGESGGWWQEAGRESRE